MSQNSTAFQTFIWERRHTWCLALAAPAVAAPFWWLGTVGFESTAQLHPLNYLVLVLVLGVAAVTDTLWKRIPNWASYPAFLWAMACGWAVTTSAGVPNRFGTLGFGQALSGFVVCFAVMLIVYACRGGGAGDVKLAAVVGALVGAEAGIVALVWCYVLAGAFSLCYFVFHQGPLGSGQMLSRVVGHFCTPLWVAGPAPTQQKMLRKPLPMAAFLALGTFVAIA